MRENNLPHFVRKDGELKRDGVGCGCAALLFYSYPAVRRVPGFRQGGGPPSNSGSGPSGEPETMRAASRQPASHRVMSAQEPVEQQRFGPGKEGGREGLE